MSNIKFNVNPFSGSSTDTCGQADGWTGGEREREKERGMDERNNSLIQFQSKRVILVRFNVSSNNKTHLGLHVMCPIFLPDFNQIWIFSTDFSESFQYQI
jgi:hypothetical protein